MPKFTETTAQRETGDGACGPFEAVLFSDSGGLTQFGAFLETLQPGSSSSIRHWHSDEDEMLYMLEGMLTVHEGAETYSLSPGEAATFKAGVPESHYAENATEAPVRYLVIGTRAVRDVVTYPESDRVLRLRRDPESKVLVERGYTTLDGAPADSPYGD